MLKGGSWAIFPPAAGSQCENQEAGRLLRLGWQAGSFQPGGRAPVRPPFLIIPAPPAQNYMGALSWTLTWKLESALAWLGMCVQWHGLAWYHAGTGTGGALGAGLDVCLGWAIVQESLWTIN